MRRRLLTFTILFACLLVVALSPPPRRVIEPQFSHPIPGPVSWSVLDWKAAEQSNWYAAAASQPVRVSLPRRNATRRGYSSTEECIIARENGGSYDRGTNPTHTGRYQFSRSTWIANGGNPDTWENASPQEQDQVFANTVAVSGYSAWTPYDGC